MPKLKTPGSIRKRFKVKKTRNTNGGNSVVFEQVKAGQGHFNAKETGATTRRKRGLRSAHKANYKNVKTMLPNK